MTRPQSRLHLRALPLAPRPASLVRLHWLNLVLLLLGVSLILAREAVEARGPRLWLLEAHRTCGLLVLGVCVTRLWLRWRLGSLPGVVQASRVVRAMAAATHAGLYGLLVALPLLGWALSSALDQSVSLFGLSLPALVAPDEDLGLALATWHIAGAWLLAGMVCVHAGAALWHHWVRRDAVLSSMWPPWGRRPTPSPSTEFDSHNNTRRLDE